MNWGKGDPGPRFSEALCPGRACIHDSALGERREPPSLSHAHQQVPENCSLQQFGRRSPVFLAVPIWSGISNVQAGREKEERSESWFTYHRLSLFLLNYYRFFLSKFFITYCVFSSISRILNGYFLIIFPSCAGELFMLSCQKQNSVMFQ